MTTATSPQKKNPGGNRGFDQNQGRHLIMMKSSIQGSLTHLYTDVRAELEAQLYNDLDDGEEDARDYRRLPAPDPQFPEVLVHNNHTERSTGTWRVQCDVGILDADDVEILALAAALTTAARQARILNAPGRVLLVLNPHPHAKLGETRQLVVGIEKDGWQTNSFRDLPNLQDRRSGYRWGDDEFQCEYVGRAEFLGEEIRDGRQYGVFAILPEEPPEESHPTHTDVDGEDG